MNKKRKISIVTSGHPPFDDRIFWKFAITFSEHSNVVQIIASTDELKTKANEILIDSFDGRQLTKKAKVNHFLKRLTSFEPDTIICCEPITILSAHRYKKSLKKKVKIISDITEYYPHYNMLLPYSGIARIFHYIKYFIFNIYVTNLADLLIIGEKEKAKLYKWIAPFKKKQILGYYAPKRFFKFQKIELTEPTTLCYSGEISPERGFTKFLEVIEKISNNNQQIEFKALIIGQSKIGFEPDIWLSKLAAIKNVIVEQIDWLKYDDFASELSRAHFFIDLRERNKLFNKSLPIKIYDYLACARPIVISDLIAIRRSIKDYQFIHLVDPDDTSQVVNILEKYLKGELNYLNSVTEANELFLSEYNWEKIEGSLLKLIS